MDVEITKPAPSADEAQNMEDLNTKEENSSQEDKEKNETSSSVDKKEEAEENAASQLLTKEIVEEETKLHKQTSAEEKRLQDKMEEQWRIETENLREQRFKRLQFLLQKSNLYTSYLMSRMQKQREVEKEKEDKRRERLHNKLETSRKKRDKQHPEVDEVEEEDKENNEKKPTTRKTSRKSLRATRENSPIIKKEVKIKQELNSPNPAGRRKSLRSSRENSPSKLSEDEESNSELKPSPKKSNRKSSPSNTKKSSRSSTPDITTDDLTEQNAAPTDKKILKCVIGSRRSSLRGSRASTPVNIAEDAESSKASSQSLSPNSQISGGCRVKLERVDVTSPGGRVKEEGRSPSVSPRQGKKSPGSTKQQLDEVAAKLEASEPSDTGSRRSSRASSRAATPVNTPSRQMRRSLRGGTPAVAEENKTPADKKDTTEKRGKKRKARDSYSITDYFAEALSRHKKVKEEQDEFDGDAGTGESSADDTAMDTGTGKSAVKAENEKKVIIPEIKVTPAGADSATSGDETSISAPQAKPKPKEEFVDGVRMINGEVVADVQPVLLSGGVLRDYQLEGFKWLKIIYENGINGILADEMGLGKTIQCISLISHIVYNGIQGPYLVCAPLSTVPNWVNEFQRFAPELPVILYHGSIAERAELRKKLRKLHTVRPGVDAFPVIVTSYEIVMNDSKHIQNLDWKFIIVDEGHRLKNFQCRLVKELKTYKSTHRLLLTGTPLQNNLSELWSLLNFLLPEIFDDLSSFEMWFDIANLEKSASNDEIVKEEQKSSIITMLHQILNPFMLRRMKCDVELGLPPKREVLVYAPMSKTQQDMHLAIRDNTIRKKVAARHEPEKAPVEVDEKGRPKRSAKKLLDYNMMVDMLNDDMNEDSGSDEEISDKKFDKWCDRAIVAKKFEDNYSGYNIDKHLPKSAEINIQLRNVMMILRKSTNHPYLIEYPLTDTGDYKIDEDVVRKSGKMLLMDCMLKELKARGHKVLIFSQMTKILDIIEDYCYLRKFNYCRLDGSMKVEDRRDQARIPGLRVEYYYLNKKSLTIFKDSPANPNTVAHTEIASFNEDPESFLFLLSTRAGGLGLNLVAADTVIIYDSDWNPQNDLQAQDRCHRIGQMKPVMVYRLVTKGTIDQKIVERAAAKRKLEKMIIHKGRFKDASMERMTSTLVPLNSEELLKLLESSDYDNVLHGKEDQVISKVELDSLLDRSDMTVEKAKAAKEAAAKAEAEDDNNNDDSQEKQILPDDPLKDAKGMAGVFKIVDTDRGDAISL